MSEATGRRLRQSGRAGQRRWPQGRPHADRRPDPRRGTGEPAGTVTGVGSVRVSYGWSVGTPTARKPEGRGLYWAAAPPPRAVLNPGGLGPIMAAEDATRGHDRDLRPHRRRRPPRPRGRPRRPVPDRRRGAVRLRRRQPRPRSAPTTSRSLAPRRLDRRPAGDLALGADLPVRDAPPRSSATSTSASTTTASASTRRSTASRSTATGTSSTTRSRPSPATGSAWSARGRGGSRR